MEKRYAGLDGRDDHMFVGFRLAVTIRFEVRETMCMFLDCDLGVDDRVISHLVESLRKMDPPGRIFGYLPPSTTGKN